MAPLRPRPGILEIEPYVGGKAEVEGMANVIKLSANEAALGPSPKAIAALRAARPGRAPLPGRRRAGAAPGDRRPLRPRSRAHRLRQPAPTS